MRLAPSHLLGARHARLRAAVASAGCGALVVSTRSNVFYLANFHGSAGLLVVAPSEIVLVLDSRYMTDGEELLASASGPPATTITAVDGSYDETLMKLLERLAPGAVGFEADDLPVARHAWWSEHAPDGIDWRATTGLVERLREVKDDHEVEVLRRAARALSALVPEIATHVTPGRRERDVAGAIEAALRSSGFSRPAFDTIVGSGPNGARPHATAGDRAIAAGDLVVLDFGGVMDGYCVDMTRTVSLGPAGAEARRVYDAVRRAQAAAIAAVRPGVAAGDVDRAAREVLDAAGLGPAFGHGTGHGLGIDVHELPRITRLRPSAARGAGVAPEAAVQAGMVFTIEPGAYLPGWGGVRIEDDVLVTPEGCELLTDAPRDLVEL